MTIGTVDLVRLLDESKRGRALTRALGAEADRWQGTLEALEQKLRALQGRLQGAGPDTPAQVTRELQREVRLLELELRHAGERSRLDLGLRRDVAREQVLDELRPVLAEVARERGLGLLLVRGPDVAHCEPALDVTKQVLERYDRLQP